MKIKIVIVLVLLIGGLISYVLWQRTSNSPVSLLPLGSKNVATPTPIPFAELTIPGLRNREYVSSLGTREVAYEAANYTAYYTSYESDGLTINGLLTIPKDTQNTQFPAVVFVHGYIPPTQYSTRERYYDYVDYLARNGLVVFKIDLRGHGESEGEAGGAYFSSDYVIDTLNARAALQTADFVKKDAIGIWGHSMAGNVTLRSMAVRPEIKAGVIWAGAVYTYTDMREYGIQDSSYQRPPVSSPRVNTRQRISDIHGEPESNSVFWQQMAPTNYLTDLKGAVQLHHAVNDDVVTVEYSRDLNILLDKTAVPHELYEYPSGGHNIDGSSFTQAMERTVSFFKKHL